MSIKILNTIHSRYLLVLNKGEVHKSYEIVDYLKNPVFVTTAICLTLYLLNFLYIPTLLVPPLVVFSYVFGGRK